jgi:hypothetical protein
MKQDEMKEEIPRVTRSSFSSKAVQKKEVRTIAGKESVILRHGSGVMEDVIYRHRFICALMIDM